MPQPAIFLDRDGVLNVNRPDDVKSWEEFEWIPGSLNAIVELTQLGYPIIIVTNQRIIGQGKLTVKGLKLIHQHLCEAVEQAGGKITAFYWCSCAEVKARCPCEKPKPYMLKKAARDYSLDLARSYMVGDKAIDIAMGINAGCHTVLVLTGEGCGAKGVWALGAAEPDSIQRDLAHAAQWIKRQHPLEAASQFRRET
jgi:D-glycero-D-manno-heptose 1,7-bisphosphate phosphatase